MPGITAYLPVFDNEGVWVSNYAIVPSATACIGTVLSGFYLPSLVNFVHAIFYTPLKRRSEGDTTVKADRISAFSKGSLQCRALLQYNRNRFT